MSKKQDRSSAQSNTNNRPVEGSPSEPSRAELFLGADGKPAYEASGPVETDANGMPLFFERRQGGAGGQAPREEQGREVGGREVARGVIDRRLGLDRRDARVIAAKEGAQGGVKASLQGTEEQLANDPQFGGFERRRGVGRRLSDFTKSAEEGEMSKEQFLFLMAIDGFKKANNKAFPTWTDVLEVIRLLGYRKTMPMELTVRNAEDWRELPDTPANVRPARWNERKAS